VFTHSLQPTDPTPSHESEGGNEGGGLSRSSKDMAGGSSNGAMPNFQEESRQFAPYCGQNPRVEGTKPEEGGVRGNK